MKKKRAIRNYIILAILLLICLVFSFISFRIPTTVDKFAGFINGIYQGIDFKGGVTATYNVEFNDYFDGNIETARDKAISRCSSLLSSQYTEFEIEKLGTDKIKLTIPRLTSSTTMTTNYLVNYVTFTTESVSEPESFVPKFTGANITSSKYFTSNGTFGALIEFNDEGKEALKEMANGLSSSGTLYIYQDKDYSSILLRITVDKDSLTQIAESKQLFVSDLSLFPNKEDAQMFADKIASGMLNIDMALDGNIEYTEATMGEIFATICWLIVLAVIILSVVYLYIRYKELTLATGMSLLSFVVMSLIVLPLFSGVQLSLAGFVGVIISYLITFAAHIVYLEKSRNEFESGKKLLAAFKSAYPKSVLANVDMFVVVALLTIPMILLSAGAIKTIASVVALLLLPSAMSSLLVHRGLCKWYLDINPTKYKKIKFEKGVTNNEE